MEETPEQARHRHRPPRIKVLFIGESPPVGGTFFYFRNSKLYRETELAFRSALPDVIEINFLSSFVKLACYLDDLCLTPVNQAGSTPDGRRWRREQRKAGEVPLAERMSAAGPEAIILIGLGIEENIRRSISMAGCSRRHYYPLPFPGRPEHTRRFHAGLEVVLPRLRAEGILGKPEGD
jgi:hypothetical protein